MKADLGKGRVPVRGAEVVEGNVYNSRGRPFYKIVVGIVKEQNRYGRSRWNNVVMIHVDARGEVIGSSNAPTPYVRDHHDLLGKVEKMPNLKIVWNKEENE